MTATVPPDEPSVGPSAIEDTSKRDPLLHPALAYDDSDSYITGMESAGQQQLVRSDRLPTKSTCDAELIALGFTLGDPDPSDDLFRPATLPQGWSRSSSDHAMWSYLLDANGRRRVAIFYKAAYYDRKAHMGLCTIDGEVQDRLWADEPDPLIIDEWTPREAWIEALTTARDRELADAADREGYFLQGVQGCRDRAARCDALLAELNREDGR